MSGDPGLIAVRPVLSYPRRARAGETYLLTIDLRSEDGAPWPYAQEEYVVYCLLQTLPLFEHRALGSGGMVLHRYGGTYGPAQFLLRACDVEQEGAIRVTLINGWGVPISTLDLSGIQMGRSPEFAADPAERRVSLRREDAGTARGGETGQSSAPYPGLEPFGEQDAPLFRGFETVEEPGRWAWRTVERVGLARFVLDNARDWLTDPRLPVNWNDLHGSPELRLALVRALYETLLAYQVRYVSDVYSGRGEVHLVRTPEEILVGPREGTSLDLSLLFCGLCLGCELIPWLMMMRGHAFVLVSLQHRLREYNHPSRPEWRWFRDGPLTDAARPRELVDSGKYVAVECTGFARSGSLPEEVPEGRRRADGLLSFDDAVAAGRGQLDYAARPFEFAIDLAVARYTWRIEPDRIPPPGPRRPGAGSRSGQMLPLLVDRYEQVDAIMQTLLDSLVMRQPRPIIFLLEGSPDQLHGALIKRLVHYDLPQLLPNWPGVGHAINVFVDLPRAASDSFDRLLLDRLSWELPEWRHERGLTWEDLAGFLNHYPSLMLITSTFSTEDWKQDGLARIELLLDAWNRYADALAGARAPIVTMIQIVYINQPESRLPRLLRWGDANSGMKAQIDRLAPYLSPGGRYPRLTAVRLPPLRDVQRADLYDWQQSAPVVQFIGPADLRREIDAMFRPTGSSGRVGALPMAQVVNQLRRLLETYTSA